MDFGSFRTIKGDTILSPSLPRLGVRISPDFIYLGNLHYISDDKHHVEQYIFINPSGIGHVTRALLIQFTGFLENTEGVYEHPAKRSVHLEGDEYFVEETVLDIHDFTHRFPHTVLGRAADYVRQRSYTLAGEMRCQRFARSVSENRRNEFVITYLEDIEDASTSSGDPENAFAEMDRALNSFTILS